MEEGGEEAEEEEEQEQEPAPAKGKKDKKKEKKKKVAEADSLFALLGGDEGEPLAGAGRWLLGRAPCSTASARCWADHGRRCAWVGGVPANDAWRGGQHAFH